MTTGLPNIEEKLIKEWKKVPLTTNKHDEDDDNVAAILAITALITKVNGLNLGESVHVGYGRSSGLV